MIRTQIYLPKELHQKLSLVAEKEKKPRAQIIREGLEHELKKRDKIAGDALLELAKLGEKLNFKAPKDLSKNIDKYLYEGE